MGETKLTASITSENMEELKEWSEKVGIRRDQFLAKLIADNVECWSTGTALQGTKDSLQLWKTIKGTYNAKLRITIEQKTVDALNTLCQERYIDRDAFLDRIVEDAITRLQQAYDVLYGWPDLENGEDLEEAVDSEIRILQLAGTETPLQIIIEAYSTLERNKEANG